MARFSQTSLNRMVGLHPDIIRVLNRAILSYDFLVIEGVRSDTQCFINWGKGRTVDQCRAKGVPLQFAKPNEAKVTWLNNPLSSNHRKQRDGYGHAVDVAPYPLDWNNLKRFQDMAGVIKEIARQEKVNLQWGGDWKKKDMPHFELI